MFDFYRYQMMQVLSACVVAAVTARLLALALPPNLAASVGTIIGFIFTAQRDEVSKQFKTDVDRVLEPSDFVKVAMFGGLVLGLLAAAVFASYSVMFAGIAGVISCVLFVSWVMER